MAIVHSLYVNSCVICNRLFGPRQMMNQHYTPLQKFSQQIFLKREDLSPTGSHKFRYFQKKISQLKSHGVSRIVRSTTGNAGISAAMIGKEFGISVFAVMSEKADLSKARQIELEGGTLIFSESPIKTAKLLSKKLNIPLIRMSQDDRGIAHYESLGNEIIQEIPNARAIVLYCTSGTSTLGIISAYLKSGLICPEIHIVHPGKLYRKQVILKFLQQCHGRAWRFKKGDIERAGKTLQAFGVESSFEGLASFHVGMKLSKDRSPVVVILTGKKWPEGKPENPIRIRSFEDIQKFINSHSLL